MEEILEIHEYSKNARTRQQERKILDQEDKHASKEGNIMKNDR